MGSRRALGSNRSWCPSSLIEAQLYEPHAHTPVGTFCARFKFALHAVGTKFTWHHDQVSAPDPPVAVFAGLCTLDVIQSVEQVPGANEKIAALDFVMAAGGPATNAAVAFAHLGGSARLATRLPDHPLTDVIRDDLTRCNVALAARLEGDGPPITASILVTQATGERAVISPSASAVFNAHQPSPPPTLEGGHAVLVDGYHRDIALPIAQVAAQKSIPVIMDAGSLKPHTADVARMVDVVVASADLATPEGSRAPADVFAWLASLGVERAAITRGADGILWRTPAGSGEVAVAPVDVIDTLGAGDFFHGALAFRLASLGTADARFAEDLAWASRMVAPSLGSFGTRAWLG